MRLVRIILAHRLFGSSVGGWIAFLILIAFFIWLGIAAWNQPSWHCRYVDYEWFCP